jgi:hypothetical protein
MRSYRKLHIDWSDPKQVKAYRSAWMNNWRRTPASPDPVPGKTWQAIVRAYLPLLIRIR